MKTIIGCLLLCFSIPLSALSASSPMVERHLFSPEPDVKGQYKTPKTLELERELLFTGVIISKHGRWAMVRERGGPKNHKMSGLRKVGDEINGMVIKEIGQNFLILTGDESDVRLNLYYEGKPRPVSAEESDSAAVEAETGPTKGQAPSIRDASKGVRKTVGPTAMPDGTPGPGMQNSQGLPPADNPFMPAMPPGSYSPDMPDRPSRSNQFAPFPQTGPDPSSVMRLD